MADEISLSKEFDALNVDDVGQGKRNLNNYISKIRSQIKCDEDRKKLFDLIEPKNDIEQLFKLEIAIVQKINDFTFAMLKSNNILLVRRILRSNLFVLHSIFMGINSEELANDVLPSLSYSTKLKFLNRLSKIGLNESLLDEYFDAIQKKYGLVLAQAILPGCSSEFILESVKQHRFLLTESQLYYIVQKDSTFARKYFQILKENSKLLSTYPTVMKYFANSNRELFWSLQEIFCFDGKLGRKTTKRVLEDNLDKIQIGEKYMKILHSGVVYTTLLKNNFLKQFITSFLPEDVEYSYVCLKMDHPVMKFLHKFLKEEKVFELIKIVFTAKYEVDFFEKIATLDDDIIEWLSKNKIEKEKIMDYIVQKEMLHLQTTEKAIPLYKERLLAADEDEVANIIVQMFENCALNDDKEKLKEILEFIFRRYRYEPSILKEVFEQLSDWPYFSQFPSDMWITMDTFFENQNLLHLMNNHLPFYFNHLIENNLPLENYFKSLVGCLHMTTIDCNPFSNKNHEKIALETFGMILEPLSESNLFSYMCLKYVEWILDYNKRNPKNIISVTRYVNIIRFFAASFYDEATEVLFTCLKQFEYEQFDIAFWKNFKLRVKENILIWYSRKHPEKLIEHMEIVFSETDYKVETFLKNLYNNPQRELINAYEAYALKVLKETNYEKASFAVLYLSTFLQTEYYNLAELLVPSPDGRMHAGTSYEKVILQKAVARGMRNTFNNERKLSLIKKYCVGYYVKYCFDTFYSVCGTTPETALILFLNCLEDPTIQKHVRGAFKTFLPKSDIPTRVKSKTPKLITTLENLSSEDAVKYLENLSKSQTWENTVSKLTRTIMTGETQKWNIEILKFLIKEILFKNDDGYEFTCKCVYALSGDNRCRLLEFTINLFTDHVNTNRHKFRHCLNFHEEVSSFIINFCKYSLESKDNKNVIDELLIKGPTVFNPEYVINAYLILEFTALYFESNFEEKEFGRKTCKMLTQYVEKYGATVMDVFAKGLNTFFAIKDFETSNFVQFINGMFEENFDTNVAVLICHIVKPRQVYDSDFTKVFDTLMSCQDAVVRFHLLRQETNYYN